MKPIEWIKAFEFIINLCQ